MNFRNASASDLTDSIVKLDDKVIQARVELEKTRVETSQKMEETRKVVASFADAAVRSLVASHAKLDQNGNPVAINGVIQLDPAKPIGIADAAVAQLISALVIEVPEAKQA